jgi:hypothetical protein
MPDGFKEKTLEKKKGVKIGELKHKIENSGRQF